jgi:adenine phosphoribosyltransferase
MWDNNRHAGYPIKKESEQNESDYFKKYCRTIENFPKQGINFRDVTPLLLTPQIFRQAIDKLCWESSKNTEAIVCIEARGFWIGFPMAYVLGVPIIPVRKKGKLPGKTAKIVYELEYGTDILELHKDAIKPNQKILLVDDILATGGTAKAVVNLVRELQGDVVGCCFLGELVDLKGKDKLDVPVYSLIKF